MPLRTFDIEEHLDTLRETEKQAASAEREALEAKLAEAEKLRAEAEKQAAEIKAKLKK